MPGIRDIEGVGDQYAEKLKAAGAGSIEKLLAAGATPKGRAALAKASRISEKLILRWVNHADLFRIKGIAGQYAELLEAAGVDTVVELAQRKPENLHAALLECNTKRKLVRSVAGLANVKSWVEQAKKLKRVVTY